MLSLVLDCEGRLLLWLGTASLSGDNWTPSTADGAWKGKVLGCRCAFEVRRDNEGLGNPSSKGRMHVGDMVMLEGGDDDRYDED